MLKGVSFEMPFFYPTFIAMKPKVLVTYDLYREGFAELMERFEVIFPPQGGFSFEEALPHLADVDAIIPTYAFKVTREVIDAAPKLRIVANYGVGYDNIDTQYAASRGVVVTNSPDPVTEPTAEMAYALMLSAARRIAEVDRRMRDGSVRWGVMSNIGTSLHRKTLGILGMGHIGGVVARYAAASQMRVMYHNRRPAAVDHGAEYVSLERLLAESDFLSVHVPLSDATRHLLSHAQFAAMKPSAIVVNTARGPIIDEEALAGALEKGEIAGAALDVFEYEPHVSQRLLALDNVVLTPHAATNTVEARNAMSAFASANVINFFEGHHEKLSRVN